MFTLAPPVFPSSKKKSAVAGIIDRGGGLRVVVGPRGNMIYHIGRGERLYLIEGLKVREPVAWGAVPALIETVRERIIAHDPSLSYLRKHVALVPTG